jgi:hypothetical protein
MQQAYVVTGSGLDDQTLQLDEALPIRGARVRVVVELLPREGQATLTKKKGKKKGDAPLYCLRKADC